MTYRAISKGGGLVELEGGVSLPEGTTVMVFVPELTRGSPRAVLETIQRLPDLDPADVDELERIIAAGKLRVREEGIFEQEAP